MDNTTKLPYTIKQYKITDQITILGHTFNGLEDIQKHCTLCGRESWYEFQSYVPEDTDDYPDVHIGLIYSNYPVFDSDDLGDTRKYQNYIFRKKPITTQDLEKTLEIPHNRNFCMVDKDATTPIPEDQLPILYYLGDLDTMMLAKLTDHD